MTTISEFKQVFMQEKWRDDFYRFLQVIFHLYREDKLHHLIYETTRQQTTDEEIYKTVLAKLPTIKPFLSELTYALPALKKQKREMARQTLQLLGNVTAIDGYVEIGSTGRYISELRKHTRVSGNIYLVNDVAPDNSLTEIFERGQLKKIGRYVDLDNYVPIPEQSIPSASVELVTCYIGLHHCPREKLATFIRSIHRILKPGGWFIMRDHDVQTKDMATFVSLVHTVFNLGLKISWEKDLEDYKSFRSVDEWSRTIAAEGFTDNGARLLQDNDPSANTLILLTKK